MNPEEFLLSESETNVYEFEKLLQSNKKYIEEDSPLESTLLNVIEMCEAHKGKIRPDLSNDLRKYFRRAVGVNDIIRKILIRKESPCFDKVWKHVLLLLEGANVSLSDDNPKGDDANNKLIELYIALSVMGFAKDLEVDHPTKSSGGKNPDIVFSYQNTSWAIACKTLNSEKAETLRTTISAGILQIDKSNADRGIVIVNMKNQIDHDKAWGIKKVGGIIRYDYYEEDLAKNAFYKMAQDVADTLSHIIGVVELDLMFKNSKAVPLVLGYFSTVTGLRRKDGMECITLLRLLHPLITKEVDEETKTVVKMLNEGMHDRL